MKILWFFFLLSYFSKMLESVLLVCLCGMISPSWLDCFLGGGLSLARGPHGPWCSCGHINLGTSEPSPWYRGLSQNEEAWTWIRSMFCINKNLDKSWLHPAYSMDDIRGEFCTSVYCWNLLLTYFFCPSPWTSRFGIPRKHPLRYAIWYTPGQHQAMPLGLLGATR